MTTVKSFKTSLVHIILLAMVVIDVYPLILMVFGSIKTSAQLAANPSGLPALPTFQNYIRLLHYNGGIILRTFANGVFIAGASTILTVFISALAAFAFAKYRFKGRDLVFIALLLTMMIPYQLEIPSLFLLMAKIGWLNTYQVQIFPGIASVFTMFIIRQYILSIPDSLLEAARVDGAGEWYIFRRIIMPMAAPVLGAMFILTFLAKWNAYLWPLVMVNSVSKLPIMVILPTLNTSSSTYYVPWELVLAGCTIVTVPMIVVFLIFQDKFLKSVAIGAVRE